MNDTFKYFRAVICIVLVVILAGCRKEAKLTIPSVTTTEVSNITSSTATSGGNITDEGSSTVLTRGVCWSTGPTPTIADNKTADGEGAGSFSSNLTGLNGTAIYYVRAFATNTAGTGYGMAISFTTLGQTTAAATNVNVTAATLNGFINDNHLSTVVTFEYGVTTSYGNTATATQSPVTGNTITNVSADITGLTAGTTYHYRVKAVNSLGTTYGNDMTFTTLGQVPLVITLAATNITTMAAQLNGSVYANYLSTVVTFEYGITTNYGSTIAVTQSPVTGNSVANVSANITGLSGNTTYHYRIVATNLLGTTNGSELIFTTNPTDIDGNIYNTITIGTQVWMKENLKTTKYRNGDLIGTTNPATLDISGEGTPKYQWAYNGNESNVATYGRLYTWYAVTDSRNVCPTGWHVPTDAEWTTLTDYLTNNGYGYVGLGNIIAKSMADTSGWATDGVAGNIGNDQSSNNSSGFTARPSGNRYNDGTFYEIGDNSYWWSATEFNTTYAWSRSLYYYGSTVSKISYIKVYGLSVRCLRD
jgi:uncharacterized protein (TIGR02145 family)